jgi:hypothetical protein
MDKREAILARLLVVLDAVEGVETVVRNRGEIPADKRPAIELWDGDEKADAAAFNKGRPAYAPNLMAMTPGLYLVLASINPDTIGTELNALRASVIKAVLEDTTLKNLTGASGDMYLSELLTDLNRAMDMKGEMFLGFTFKYALDPRQL